MKVTLTPGALNLCPITMVQGDVCYDVPHKVSCEIGNAVVEVRQSQDGHAMIIVIPSGANVSIEPRAQGIWFVVKENR